EEILISSPYELTISTIETFATAPATTPAATVTDENGETVETTVVTEPPMPEIKTLILSTSTKKIHYYEACSYAASIMDKNRKTASVEHEDELIKEGYTVCSWCEKKRGA
ncbi:MAG: hypothetical protein IJX76_06400, partial [Clostridia bacterium]|nr:hypothetical protein [Clostridia bacterium]